MATDLVLNYKQNWYCHISSISKDTWAGTLYIICLVIQHHQADLRSLIITAYTEDWGYSVHFCHYALCSKYVGHSRITWAIYVHPRKTRVYVPTYSGGHFTQDTVPSVKNRWVFFASVAVSLCKSIGAILSHGEAILTLDIRTSKLAEVGYPYIENSMLNTLVPVSNLYCVAYVRNLRRSRPGSARGAIPSRTRPIVQRLYTCRKRNSPGTE